MKLYFLQFNERKSSIFIGKIKPQSEGFNYYQNSGLIKKYFLMEDISEEPNERIFNTGCGFIKYRYGAPKKINRFLNWRLRRKWLFNAVYRFIKDNEYTHIYIRRPNVVDSEFIDFINKIKRLDVKIIYDIPTYPYDDELPPGKLKIDQKYRECLKNYVDLIASPSPVVKGDRIFGIPFINVPNGVVVNGIKECKSERYSDNTIAAIAVAGLSKWHGYDRFIEGLNSYYKNGGERNIVFHIVGGKEDSPAYQEYRNLIKKYGLEDHVILHGSKFGSELDDIYDKCNIGIASLAFHRTGIYSSSALKTREYLAKGLPIYASTRIDIHPQNGEFIHYCKEDDSPIDIADFISFYDSVYVDTISYREVHDRIRNFAREKCDIRELMRPLIEKMAAM